MFLFMLYSICLLNDISHESVCHGSGVCVSNRCVKWAVNGVCVCVCVCVCSRCVAAVCVCV